MPFQRSDSAASTQLLFTPGPALGASEFASSSAAMMPSKSALAESSSKPRDASLAQHAPPARKQHHVSFQDDPEPPPKPNRRRERSHRSSQSSSRAEASDHKDRSSEHGSAKHSTSRASSRQGRNDPSEPESSKSAGADSAPASSSSRNRRSARNRKDKRSERNAQRASSEPAASATDALPHSRPHSRAATSTKSEASTSASKRDPRSREPSASGRSSRNHSNQGILPDLRSANDASRSESAARSQHSSSSRRDRFARSNDTRSTPGDAPAARDGRQLFDPRRDDPVKFASQHRLQVDERARTGSSVSSPRLASSSSLQPQILMRADASECLNPSAHARSPIIKPAISDVAFTPAIDPADPRALQAHVAEIKKVYQSISAMEKSLQDTHLAEAERARIDMADYIPPDVRDPSHWITMIGRHRSLADLHSSFFEMTCRPELPRSVQELAETYNLPSRLWQNAFHLMLESLRTNLASQPSAHASNRKAELLDYLTEFIYFAYSFYSALHESETYKNFRRAWIESLGDLSRYRMAVAGLAASMAIDGGGDEIRNKRHEDSRRALAVDARIDDPHDDTDDDADDDDSLEDINFRAGADRADARRRRSGRGRRGAASRGDNVDKASIGSAALGDWEWTEKETWRQTAKDWYAMGITEAPNAGRLHHHLGVLSRGDNDLRALHHLAKSLVTTKPFPSARDSLLTLFDQERQSRRLGRDSSIEELFLYLHGLLITRIQLDDFEPVFDRLLAQLSSLIEEHGPAALPQSTWTMMATVNIAGLFEYGSDDAVLGDLLLQPKSGRRAPHTERSKASVPTAILVSASTAKTDDNLLSELPRDAEWDDPSEDEDEAGDELQLIALEPKAGADEGEAAGEVLPDALERAARLCFAMQALTFDLTSADASLRSNPYNTTVATFLLSLCQSKKAFRMLERFVPWEAWLQRLDASLGLVERSWPKVLASSYITPPLLLPEDYCLRGVVGLSRQLYDRQLWRPAAHDAVGSGVHAFANEVEVLDAEDGELYTRAESAWRAGAARRGEREEAAATLDAVRLYRMAFVARKLARAGRGFELDGKTTRLGISRMLVTRQLRRRMQEEQRELEARIRTLRLQSSVGGERAPDEQSEATAEDEQEGQADEDDDFDSDWEVDDAPAVRETVPSLDAVLSVAEGGDASDEMQALHARSCYLREVLSSVQQSISGRLPGRAVAPERLARHRPTEAACEGIVAGYTVLVVDTNVIVTPGEVVVRLIESQRWTLIIPLAVVTELDGLRRNDTELGREAERAIRMLEARIRSHPKCVKVQTSRGNYLSDLACRSEHIDFAWQGSAVDETQGEAERADAKSAAARNVDEVILRILAWQNENFVDRRNLLRAGMRVKEERSDVDTAAAHRCVLLTLDRNLRLKAKSRGLASLDAKAAAQLLDLPSW